MTKSLYVDYVRTESAKDGRVSRRRINGTVDPSAILPVTGADGTTQEVKVSQLSHALVTRTGRELAPAVDVTEPCNHVAIQRRINRVFNSATDSNTSVAVLAKRVIENLLNFLTADQVADVRRLCSSILGQDEIANPDGTIQTRSWNF